MNPNTQMDLLLQQYNHLQSQGGAQFQLPDQNAYLSSNAQKSLVPPDQQADELQKMITQQNQLMVNLMASMQKDKEREFQKQIMDLEKRRAMLAGAPGGGAGAEQLGTIFGAPDGGPGQPGLLGAGQSIALQNRAPTLLSNVASQRLQNLDASISHAINQPAAMSGLQQQAQQLSLLDNFNQVGIQDMMTNLPPGRPVNILPLQDSMFPDSSKLQEEHMKQNKKSLEQISKQLWKSQKGAYGKVKYNEVQNMSLRERVELKVKL